MYKRQGSRFVVYEHPWHGEELDFRHVVKKARPHIATNAEFIKRLNRFSDRLMALRHTHIEDVAAVQFGLGDCALLCERIDGENLAQVLQKGGRPTLEDARIICKQVAEALDAAHSVGFFHGCLSPERIHFTQEYKPGGGGLIHVKARGFGMGKPLTGGLFGTTSYLAPEQVDPDATSLDPVSYTHLDVYKRQVVHFAVCCLPTTAAVRTRRSVAQSAHGPDPG